MLIQAIREPIDTYQFRRQHLAVAQRIHHTYDHHRWPLPHCLCSLRGILGEAAYHAVASLPAAVSGNSSGTGRSPRFCLADNAVLHSSVPADCSRLHVSAERDPHIAFSSGSKPCWCIVRPYHVQTFSVRKYPIPVFKKH